jgi:hypothetical protein
MTNKHSSYMMSRYLILLVVTALLFWLFSRKYPFPGRYGVTIIATEQIQMLTHLSPSPWPFLARQYTVITVVGWWRMLLPKGFFLSYCKKYILNGLGSSGLLPMVWSVLFHFFFICLLCLSRFSFYHLLCFDHEPCIRI